MRASENRVRAVFGQAAVGILIADLSGRLLEINPRLCQILERNCEQLYVMTCEDLTHPDDRSRNKAMMQEVADGKRAEFTAETRYLRNNGAWIWVNVAVTPLRDAGGRIEQLLGVIEDIHGARRRKTHSARQTGARTSFWQRWRTSSAIHWPDPQLSSHPAARRIGQRGCGASARDDRAAGQSNGSSRG